VTAETKPSWLGTFLCRLGLHSWVKRDNDMRECTRCKRQERRRWMY